MSVDIHDVITCAAFCDDRLRGSGVARGRISRFPIDLRRRPYNTLALPCECVITTPVPIPNSKGNPFSGGVKYTGVGKIDCFGRKSPFVSETVRERPMVTMER